jgi:hypothetical protein
MFDDWRHVMGLSGTVASGLRCMLNSMVNARYNDLYLFKLLSSVIP